MTSVFLLGRQLCRSLYCRGTECLRNRPFRLWARKSLFPDLDVRLCVTDLSDNAHSRHAPV